MARYAVVGGGITGLVGARALRRAGAEVVLFEASGSVGGKIRTTGWLGGRVEEGADSFLAREETILDLVRELDLEDELIEPDVFGALVWTGEKLEPLPKDTVLGLPLDPLAAWRHGPLSLGGALRALLELLNARRLGDDEVAVGAFVRERFGDEVLELMVDPILAGTRAGDPERLSLAAALPSIHALARERGSLIRALRAARSAGVGAAAPPRFLSFRAGMSRLVDALEADLANSGVELRTSTPITSISVGDGPPREADGELRASTPVTSSSGGNRLLLEAAGTPETFDAVLLALPAHAAASLVEPIDRRAALLLRSIRHASVTSIAFAFEARRAPRLEGSGILVPSRRGNTLSAATWFSRKWSGTAPDGMFVARCFVGRAGTHPALALDDDGLADAALRDLRALTGIRGEPSARLVTRWYDALPQYELGHLERVTEAESILSPHRIEVAGASYRGSGLSDCVAQAETAARRLLGTRVTSGDG